MTVGSDVKKCYSTLKTIEVSLADLAIRTQEPSSAKSLSEAAQLIKEVKETVRQRVGEIEREELQYKGF
ncbi:MAG: DUF1657 domain-containing protein [Bacillus sp. (in: firmicutes)]